MVRLGSTKIYLLLKLPIIIKLQLSLRKLYKTFIASN